MTLCVLLGNYRLREDTRNEQEASEKMIKITPRPSFVQGDYATLLAKSLSIIDGKNLVNEQKVTYDLMKNAANAPAQSTTYSVTLLNRDNDTVANFSLQDDVLQTAREFIYDSNQLIGDVYEKCETMELYVLQQEAGGK